MAQRIHNLSKWRYLAEGRSLHYSGRAQRTVVVEVNCPEEVQFYAIQERSQVLEDPERVSAAEGGRWDVPVAENEAPKEVSGDSDASISFLGVCKGRDTLEFAVDGPFDLLVDGGGAYVFSNDGQDIATRIAAPLIFTRIANRRQRNPHLEMMQFQMRLNQQRMQEELLGEISRREAALEQRLESYAAQRDEHAPPELVGKARRDGSAIGGAEPDAGAPEPPPDEGGPGEEAPRKRRKTEPVADV